VEGNRDAEGIIDNIIILLFNYIYNYNYIYSYVFCRAFENTKKSEVRKSESPKLHPPELFAKLGRKIGVKKGGLLRFYLQEL